MSTFRVAVLAVCLFTLSLHAQEAPPATVQSDSVHEIVAQADYSGTNGAVLLESPATTMLLKAIGASMPMTFETNGAERMRIFPTGNISIGSVTGSPTTDGKLAIFDIGDGTKSLTILHNATIESGSPFQTDYALWATAKHDIAPGAAQSLVIGAMLEAYNSGTGSVGGAIGLAAKAGNLNTGTITTAYGISVGVGNMGPVGSTLTNGYGIMVSDVVATNDYAFYQAGANDTNYFAGDLGIGALIPAHRLHVVGNAALTNPDAASFVTLYLNGTTSGQGSSINAMGPNYTAQPNSANSAGSLAIMNYEAGGLSLTSSNASAGNVRIYTAGSGAGNERMRIIANGNVGIGTQTPTFKLHVQGGDIYASGNISAGGTIFAKYQDVAEWVPSTTDLLPGTVVVLNTDKDNEVMASEHPYDTAVAGVVSAQPGLVLGVGSDTKEQIATSGRVLVRVDARNAPVRIGDLLVTSDLPGTAMRSQPIDLGGHKIHQPGTIIGKALQPLEDGVGEILVLLSMQ